MKRTILAISVIAALLTAGCSSSDDQTSESSTEPTAVANFEGSSSACDHPQTFTTPELKAPLEAAPLPDGVKLVNEQSVGNIDTPGEIDVVVRICQSGLTGDPFKDAATVVAQTVKASPVSDQVASLRVSNTAEDSNPEGKVRVDDFGLHTFSATADAGAVRAGWLYPSEK